MNKRPKTKYPDKVAECESYGLKVVLKKGWHMTVIYEAKRKMNVSEFVKFMDKLGWSSLVDKVLSR